jgi:hypothetical protein
MTMTDLDQRFRRLAEDLSTVPVPRLPTPTTEAREPMRQGSESRRVVTILIALAVGIAGTLVAVRAFDGPPTKPANSSAPSVAAPTFSPKFADRMQVGPNGQTGAILYAAGSVWVSAYGATSDGGPDGDVLYRIDPSTDRIVATIPVVGASSWEFGGGGLAFGDGSVWVTGSGTSPNGVNQAVLTQVDPGLNRAVKTVWLGGRFGADVSIYGNSAWVGIFAAGHAQLVQVDTSSGAIEGRVMLATNYVRRVLASADGVTVEERVWHKSPDEGPCDVVTTVDPTTDKVVDSHPAWGGTCPSGMLFFAGTEVWEWTGSGGFVQIDPPTGAAEGSPVPTEQTMTQFVVSDGTGVWLCGFVAGAVGPDLGYLDLATGASATYDVVGKGATTATVGGGAIWTLGFDGTVARIDLNPQAEKIPAPSSSSEPPSGAATG